MLSTSVTCEREGAGRRREGDDEAVGYELQCLDCFAIFEAEGPPGGASCDVCGSTNIAVW